jgi:hypothetical protein
MKNIYLYPVSIFLILFAGLTVNGCKDDGGDAAQEGLSIKVFSPAKVIEGQKVVITGTGLSEATAVIFPGDINVTAIEVTSDNMISVIVPAGIPAQGGQLAVKAGDETAVARVPLALGNPQYTAMTPSQKIGGGDELLIVGLDMEFYEKVIFPGEEGDIVMEAMDFERRSTSQLRVIVPRGLKSGPGRVKLVTISGSETLLPQMELTAGPSGEFQWVEFKAWEGAHDLDGWGQNFYVEVAWFNEIVPQAGDVVKFYFDVYAYDGWPQCMFNNGDWSSAYVEGLENGNMVNKNNYLTAAGAGEYEMPPLAEDGFLPWFTGVKGANALVINGEGMTFTKVAILRQMWVEF